MTTKLLQLEGLRGVASLMVVAHHLRPFLLFACPGEKISPKMLPAFDPFEPLHNGTLAVWIFWVMSAIVLSIRYFELKASQEGTAAQKHLTSATLRRYPRLFIPVLGSCIFALFLMKCGLMTNLTSAEQIKTYDAAGAEWLVSLTSFSPTLRGALTNSITFSGTYNPVLWSMKYEFLGSMFLFSYLASLGESWVRKPGYLLLGVICWKAGFEWLNCFVAGIAIADLYVTLTRLKTGEGPAQAKFRRIHDSSMIAVCLAAVIYLLSATVVENPAALFSAATLIVGAVMISRPLSSLLSMKYMLFLGRISFGVYLLHVPIIGSFTGWLLNHSAFSGGGVTSATVLTLMTISACIIAGFLFYKIVDRPSVLFAKKAASFLLSRQSFNMASR